MTPHDWAALARAPKRRGAQVTVRAYDIQGLRGPHEHMYVEYDDGREHLIARGGPSGEGLSFLGQATRDELRVVGGVTPAKLSKDHGRGGRVVFEGFVPGVSAQQAAEPARRNAQALEREHRRYRWGSNSNSYAADAVEPLFGVRPGDPLTPGFGTRLNSAARTRPSGPYGNPLDLLPR